MCYNIRMKTDIIQTNQSYISRGIQYAKEHPYKVLAIAALTVAVFLGVRALLDTPIPVANPAGNARRGLANVYASEVYNIDQCSQRAAEFSSAEKRCVGTIGHSADLSKDGIAWCKVDCAPTQKVQSGALHPLSFIEIVTDTCAQDEKTRNSTLKDLVSKLFGETVSCISANMPNGRPGCQANCTPAT